MTNKRFNHLMIDLETLGTAANAPVIASYNNKMQGVAHTALDDAVHQAKLVSAYGHGLRSKTKTYFYYHPESDSAFSSDRDDLHGTGDGLVEEINEEQFLNILSRQKSQVAVLGDSELLI